MSQLYTIPDDTLHAIGDAIRLKRDTVDEINPEDMPLEISLIEGGGGGNDNIFTTVVSIPPQTDAEQTINVDVTGFIDTVGPENKRILFYSCLEYLGSEPDVADKPIILKISANSILTADWFIDTQNSYAVIKNTNGALTTNLYVGVNGIRLGKSGASTRNSVYIVIPKNTVTYTHPAGDWRFTAFKIPKTF